jgi:hypothetical protein
MSFIDIMVGAIVLVTIAFGIFTALDFINEQDWKQ